MTPIRVVFLLFPIGVFILTVLLKTILNFSRKMNVLIILITYVIANFSLYMLVRGAFITTEFSLSEELELLMSFRLRQWLDLLLVPNTFTFMYLIICLCVLWVMDRIQIKKVKVVKQQGHSV